MYPATLYQTAAFFSFQTMFSCINVCEYVQKKKNDHQRDVQVRDFSTLVSDLIVAKPFCFVTSARGRFLMLSGSVH